MSYSSDDSPDALISRPHPMLLYRGSLKSCNYHCSYCPFSKHPIAKRELEKDKSDWLRFCQSLAARAETLGLFGVMVVPYGEAMIHPWYWKGLGILSRLPQTEAIGIQTNLSFSLDDFLTEFLQSGGIPEKLRLWATFHPEMISPEVFAQACQNVRNKGILLSAGAVGVPENLPLLTRLRSLLPPSVCLWINKMDGLKRPYTQAEEQQFTAIDPLFSRELSRVPADKSRCRHRLFIEGSGIMRTCNLTAPLPGNWYQEPFAIPSPECRRKTCSCYLAYAGRDDFANHLLFGRYPLFRIPRRYRAVFLDIDGTILPQGETQIPSLTAATFQAFYHAEIPLFFATNLPFLQARRKCREIWPLFSGGIFAGGAHLRFDQEEQIYPLEPALIHYLNQQRSRFHFRFFAYRQKTILCKITLSRPQHCPWTLREIQALSAAIPPDLLGRIRIIHEENRLQFIDAKAGKAKGIRTICTKLNIPLWQTAAVGNIPEDREMLSICGTAIAIPEKNT